jgi:hypothetical protein
MGCTNELMKRKIGFNIVAKSYNLRVLTCYHFEGQKQKSELKAKPLKKKKDDEEDIQQQTRCFL